MTKKIKVPMFDGHTVKEMEIPGPYESLEDAMEANERAGRLFFSRDTMKAFDSRPGEILFGRFFIDNISNFDHTARVFKICVVYDDGEVFHVCQPPDGWDGEERAWTDEGESWKSHWDTYEGAETALLTIAEKGERS